MSSERLAALFRLLKVIRRTIDEWRETAAMPSDDAADRQRVDALRAAGDVEGLHAACVEAFTERDRGRRTIKTIAGLIAVADLPPRTQNRGVVARRALSSRRSARSSRR